jgi:hypothetical protein
MAWWVQVLQAFLTPLIAVLAIYIAYQQWRVNVRKLRLDLFDRRWAVYQAVIAFIATVCTDFKVKAADIGTLRRATVTADFLFGPEIPTYIDELCDRAIKLAAVQAKYRSIADPPPPADYDHSAVTAAMAEGEKWFGDQLERRTINLKFTKYLDVDA